MSSVLIRNARIVNRGQIMEGDVLVQQGRIVKVAPSISEGSTNVIDAKGLYLLPGIIDDQVHFRQPGLTHKADIASEAKAAIAGGVTSFMEMPNTNPTSTTQGLLQEKYDIAAKGSLANYSFYMGATNDNLDEVLRTDPKTVCGVKVFMGSSTGNMLVDQPVTLERIFKDVPILIATHCEDETTIRTNLAAYKEKYGEHIKPGDHPKIRSIRACYLSSSMAAELAKQHNTRLHILHISTAKEIELFDNSIPLEKKRITAEVCVHHLFFHEGHYTRLGNRIKCNPAIKSRYNQQALFQALLDDRFDVIATDHAPHTREEKSKGYLHAPSGLPLVQHTLNVMLSFYHQDKISLERIVEKMCHAPAIAFQVKDRGYLDEGMWADMVLVDINAPLRVMKNNIHYKCGWSPLEGMAFKGNVQSTFVNGHRAFHNGVFDDSVRGMRLGFVR